MNYLKERLEAVAIASALQIYGVSVQTTRGIIIGVFEAHSKEIELLNSLNYTGPVPILRIKSSDAEYLEVEDELKIEGSYYTIRDIEPDTHNQTKIRLVKN